MRTKQILEKVCLFSFKNESSCCLLPLREHIHGVVCGCSCHKFHKINASQNKCFIKRFRSSGSVSQAVPLLPASIAWMQHSFPATQGCLPVALSVMVTSPNSTTASTSKRLPVRHQACLNNPGNKTPHFMGLHICKV